MFGQAAFSSYPPLFVQPSDPEVSVKPVSNSSPPIVDGSDPFPCIDLLKLNPEEIGKACSDWGMFRLVNHGIPVELSSQLQELSKKLFSLPFETKQTQLQSPMSYFWGTPALTPNGVALTQCVQNVNRFEGIFALLSQLPQMPGDDPMLTSFRNLLEEYGKHMGRLARCLFEALEENVGVDPDLSQAYLSEATGLFRVYRYLQCSEPDKGEGLGAHTDSSLLSKLNQNEVGGLQIFKDDGNLLEEYGKHMGRLARCLFEALRENVGVDPDLSQAYLSEATGLFRVYRYLQCSEPDKGEGLGAHTDSSLLSILNQNEVGGLQIFKDDKWNEVRPITNTLIVNLGDMFQAMSNDEYKSASHRVMNQREERISICYFVFPEDDSVIKSTKYKPFTYKEFQAQVQEDIKTIGYKVGLQRFL